MLGLGLMLRLGLGLGLGLMLGLGPGLPGLEHYLGALIQRILGPGCPLDCHLIIMARGRAICTSRVVCLTLTLTLTLIVG